MTRRFQFRELTLYAPDRHYTYQFVPGVNLIVGPVGSGKTSLLELLKYALGGSAVLSPAVQETVVAASVAVEIGRRSIVLLREVGSTTVTTHSSEGEQLGVHSIAAGRSNPPISDALLEWLDLPALRVPRSRRRPTSASSRLSFFDVYAYLYLSQTEIDRSVVAHLDSNRDPKRRATFELLYGLSNATLLDLDVQRGELTEERANEQRRLDSIRAFLAAAGQPNREQIRRQRELAAASVEVAQATLRALRLDARSSSHIADSGRQLLRQLQATQDLEREDLAETVAGADRLRSLAAQLDLDAQRIEKAISADEVMSGLEFRVCPRCLQPLEQHRVEQGACYLCLQVEDQVDLRARLEDELRRVQLQRLETVDLLSEDERAIAELRSSTESRAAEIEHVREEIDRASAEFVSPRFAAIEETSTDIGRLAAQLDDFGRIGRLWDEYGAVESRIRELDRRLEDIGARMEEARAGLNDGVERVATLATLFAEILEQFQLPWLETATIDLQTYLPIVNGRSFEELSSGGMKTLVNDAYHLASLRYALAYADSLLPLIQVIDSPRKNLGSGPEDRVLSTNLYRRIRALQDAFGDTFQIIIADNDVPEIAAGFPSIELSYEEPSIPFQVHPGPDQVETIGGAQAPG